MSKDGKKKKEPVGLRTLLSSDERNQLRSEVLEKKDPYLESERVLVAQNQRVIQQIIDHVKECERRFVTREKANIAPVLPDRYLSRMEFQVPTEITPPRERAYFQDRHFFLRSLEAEVRQEPRLGAYKQTTKIGSGGATSTDSTLDRMEQASRITGFGFNVYAIGDKDLRNKLLEKSPTLIKPVLRMVSQRERICYHPNGDPDVLIEMALERIHVGQTFNGFAWSKPKIDLEIKMGPEEKGMRHSILAREEKRLRELFGSALTKELASSPTPGFEALEEFLSTDKGRAAFDALETRAKWWEKDGPTQQPRMRA